ncbi:hypothetical protein HYR99_11675 [Candidatus Poribacteria bacterium]|nr:hypothetical protein [Candidatus Poribacteria bacterium]
MHEKWIQKLLLVIGLSFILTCVLVWLFWDNVDEEKTDLYGELVKLLMQLGLIVLCGGVVAGYFNYKINARERERQRAIRRATSFQDYLTRVGSAYRTTKSARRYLRAAGLSRKYIPSPGQFSKLQAKVYNKEMIRINEAQLQLEELKIEAKSHPELHSIKELYEQLKIMEKYLSEIVGEYERTAPELEKGTRVDFGNLPNLDEFTGSTQAKGTRTKYRLINHFADPYDNVVKLISTHLGEAENTN